MKDLGTEPEHPPKGTSGQLVLVCGALVTVTFVAALDTTIVSTALPVVVRELGQFSLYPWVFNSYLIASASTTPLWGYLADQYGRKPVLLVGLTVFVVGSVLCGASPSLVAMALFRSIQGIGAGCLYPISLTIVADILSINQRARFQVAFSSIWALAAGIGPAAGATLVSSVGWRWIFFVNLPIGLLAASLLFGYVEQKLIAQAGSFDYLGSVLLAAGIATLILGLGAGKPGGQQDYGVILVAAILLSVLVVREFRMRRLTLPVRLISNPEFAVALAISALIGATTYVLNAYVPLFVQDGWGGGLLQSGWAVAPISIGWLVSASLGVPLALRAGLRPTMIYGSTVMVLGSLVLLEASSVGVLAVATAALVLGLGMGVTMTPLTVAMQSSAAWGERGAITALNQFLRTLGGVLALSMVGVLLASRGGPSALRVSVDAIQLTFELVVGFSIGVLVLVLLSAVVVKRHTLRLNGHNSLKLAANSETRASGAGSPGSTND